jgi:hypothetical protein
MAWPPGKHFETIVGKAKEFFAAVSIERHEIGDSHGLLDLEGSWKEYRIIISEIHRQDNSWRYAYYILDSENKIVHAFDNSPDISAVKQKYELDWKSHFHEEIPHEHDGKGNILLSPTSVSFEDFLNWIVDNF